MSVRLGLIPLPARLMRAFIAAEPAPDLLMIES